jgi:D-glycero-D-manno-heptose 1,7-bisphosphate phosphatase
MGEQGGGFLGEKMRRIVFLDRDGVLIEPVVRDGRPYPPANKEEARLLPDAMDACRLLKSAGFLLIVVTNQPDVARGSTPQESVEKIHSYLKRELPLDDVFACYHDDRDNCECRKPKPGMILEAARRWRCDPSVCFMVGDRWRDVEAGKRAGCKTLFIDYGYEEPLMSEPDVTVQSFGEASRRIVASEKPPRKGEKDGDKNRRDTDEGICGRC